MPIIIIIIIFFFLFGFGMGKQQPKARMVIQPLMQKPEYGADTNRVKCVVDNHGYAIYFSRGLIPYNKLGKVNPQFPYLLHLGIQSYDSEFLRIYPELPPTPLQLEEDLEQLKVLENGYKMKVIKVNNDAHAVDTPEIESLVRERNIS